MAEFVYFITSLPSLTFSSLPPISLDEFEGNAETQLSTSLFKRLKNLNLISVIDSNESGVIREFVHSSQDVHNELNHIREARQQNQVFEPRVLPMSTLKDKDPLQIELAILEWYWKRLDEIEFDQHFNFTKLLIYRLKLQILWRKNSFNLLKGVEILKKVSIPDMKGGVYVED